MSAIKAQFNMLVLTSEGLYSLGPDYLTGCPILLCIFPDFRGYSWGMKEQSFRSITPNLWNALPQEFHLASHSLSFQERSLNHSVQQCLSWFGVLAQFISSFSHVGPLTIKKQVQIKSSAISPRIQNGNMFIEHQRLNSLLKNPKSAHIIRIVTPVPPAQSSLYSQNLLYNVQRQKFDWIVGGV